MTHQMPHNHADYQRAIAFFKEKERIMRAKKKYTTAHDCNFIVRLLERLEHWSWMID